MQFKKQSLVMLAVITFLAGILRWYQLTELVPTLNRDEAALAYNSLLLKETGRDEWGVAWPITPQSFGDSKLIGYHLLLVGLYSFLPVADWVVRLPALLAGSLLVVATYALARSLKLRQSQALLSALFVATTPALFHFSRFAYEAMVALCLVVFALAMLLTFQKNQKKRLSFDLVAGALLFFAQLTYNTPLLLVPSILVSLPFFRGVKNVKRWLPGTSILAVTWVVSLALLWPMLSQKSGISIFSDQTYLQAYPAYRESFAPALQTVLGNQYLFYLKAIVGHLLTSLNPTFLVLSGGAHPWHSLIGYGHTTWVGYLLGMLGFVAIALSIIRRHRSMQNRLRQSALFFLLIFSLVPAAITVDAPHATRSLLFFVWLAVMAAISISAISKRLPIRLAQPKLYWGLLVIAGAIQVVCFTGYFIDYVRLYPRQAQRVYQAGFAAVIRTVESEFPEKKVAIVDPGGYQYILLAWYLKLSPADFIATIVKQQPDQIGLRYGEQVGRYHFIGQAGDRSESERILIYWEADTNTWQYQLL